MATQLATQERASPIVVLRQNLQQMAPELKMALPAHVTVEKFSRVAMTAIQNNPDLLNSDRKSLFGAIVRLAQDGLLPDGREAALVMFGNKVQAMPMIAGVLKKIRQSGDVAKVSAQVVYENDEFVWHLGFDEDVTHNPPPLDKPRGKAIGAYATAVLKDGSRLLEVMSLEEIEKVRAVSRAKGNGPWVSWWGEMARKTVMRRLSKRLPMSTDLMDEIDRDPTMPANDDVIDHAPQPVPLNRLDALERHIEADQDEDHPAAGELEVPADDEPSHNAGDAAAPAETLADKMAKVAASTKKPAPETVEFEEGPADTDRGEKPSLADALADIRGCEIIADIDPRVASYEGQLSGKDMLSLQGAAMDRMAELKGN